MLYNKKEIKIIELNNNRKIYSSEKFDITIIEIKPNKDKINYLLEIDENINELNSNEIYSEKSIYLLIIQNILIQKIYQFLLEL